MARDRLHDAMESAIFVCGMGLLDQDDPCYDVFLYDTSLDCIAHIEAIFYTSKIQPARVELCCYCAGEFDSPVELNSSLKAPDGPYSLVLHVSKMCLNNGGHVIVRGARQNAQAKQDKLNAQAAREVARFEKTVSSEGATASAEAHAAAPSTSRKRRATKYTCTHCVSIYVYMHAHCNYRHIAITNHKLL